MADNGILERIIMYNIQLYNKIKELTYVGYEFKNYKVLCEELNLPYKAGNSKQANLKQIDQFCTYIRKGNKYVITSIYERPKEKLDHRHQGNNSIYIHSIEAILLNYFIKCETNRCNFTKRKLYELLGLVNSDYYEKRTDKNFVYEMRDIVEEVTNWNIKNFYRRCDNFLNQIIRSALNSLKNRRLIEYEIAIVGVKLSREKKEKHEHIKDDSQIETIIRIERESIDELIGSTRADGTPTSL